MRPPARRSVLLTETSDTWVPLHDELTFLPKRKQFVWASSRSGYRQLYLYDFAGKQLRQLTRGRHQYSGRARRSGHSRRG